MSFNCYPVGLDLGTTYSTLIFNKNNNLDVLRYQSKYVIPSYVKINNLNSVSEVEIGQNVKEELESKTKNEHCNIYYNLKRLIGREYDEVKEISKKYFFKISKRPNKTHNFSLVFYQKENKIYLDILDVYSLFIQKIRQLLKETLQYGFNDIVVTIPAYFTIRQRNATIQACQLAGFNVVQVAHEPTAAAIMQMKESKLLIFDWGGGTLDLSVVQKQNENDYVIKELVGDNQLGGEDIDNILLDYCLVYFENENENENVNSPESLPLIFDDFNRAKLKHKIENAKKNLFVNNQETVFIKKFWKNYDLSVDITRELLYELLEPIKFKIISLLQKLEELPSEIILIGGSSYLTCHEGLFIEMIIKEYTETNNLKMPFIHQPGLNSNNPNNSLLSVAAGACQLCQNYFISSNWNIKEVIPHNIGTEDAMGKKQILIKANTPYPCMVQQYITTCRPNQSVINFKIWEETADNEPLTIIANIHYEVEDPGPIGKNKYVIILEVDHLQNFSVNIKPYKVKTESFL